MKLHQYAKLLPPLKPANYEAIEGEYTWDDALKFFCDEYFCYGFLSNSQRAMVGAKWIKLQESSLNQRVISLKSINKQTSKLLGVGTSTIDRAKLVITKGAEGLASAVEKGTITVDAARRVASLPQDYQLQLIAAGPNAIKAKAAEIRKERVAKGLSQKNKQIEPFIAGVTTESKCKPLPKWIPDDANRLWLLAKTYLEKILLKDRSREQVLQEVIKYAQNKIQNNY